MKNWFNFTGGERILPLTQGKFALVSGIDYDKLKQYKWYAHNNSGRNWYVRTKKRIGRNWPTILMHRFVLSVLGKIRVDHINGNGLDNCRTNLRTASNQQNQRNQTKIRGASQYKGVIVRGDRITAQIRVGGKAKSLGDFKSEAEAARTYDEAALRYFGGYAKTNKMLGLIEE